ncbi:MAG: putative toxin-antitoxin system toxin component, PIN family [Planctomycetes bacterium]|nr:putative toxin-antitoxin system toxin component, PIN family [Planctomycetota bacterium]
MLRAVLDANVLISALLRPAGPPGEILRRFLEEGAFELVLTPGIAAETARALAYPGIRKRLPAGFVPEDWVEDLALLAIVVEDGPAARVCRDPADDRYLAAAAAGGAVFLVTGDDDLLVLREHAGVLLVTPRQFLGVVPGGAR